MMKSITYLLMITLMVNRVTSDNSTDFSPDDVIAFLEQAVSIVTDITVTKSDVNFYFSNQLFTDLKLDPSANYGLLLFAFQPTKFIVHGWTSSYQSEFVSNMTEEFLKLGGYNIVKVDYQRVAGTFYTVAVSHIEEIGQLLFDFIKTQNLNAENIHLIGHSLGAHVSGIAAKKFSNETGMKIKRISGLDPAGPLFHTSPDKRVDVNDAHIVDIHHTDGLVLGIAEAIGSLDIFYNGGLGVQPECENDAETTNSNIIKVVNEVCCSHSKSTFYFAQLINDIEVACAKCNNYRDYAKNLCENNGKYVFGEEDINEITVGTCYVTI